MQAIQNHSYTLHEKNTKGRNNIKRYIFKPDLIHDYFIFEFDLMQLPSPSKSDQPICQNDLQIEPLQEEWKIWKQYPSNNKNKKKQIQKWMYFFSFLLTLYLYWYFCPTVKEVSMEVVSHTPQQQRLTISSQVYVNEEYVHNIPKILWMYESPTNSYLSELIYTNNAYFAKKSQYQLIFVNRTNYKTHLSAKNSRYVQKLIDFLENRSQGCSTSNLKFHLPNIIKKIILLNILNENGGIITDGEFAMTEDFSWINNIIRNKYVNRGNRGIKPQVVGFYSVDYSFKKKAQNIKTFLAMNEVDKYMIIFPTLENFFISATKNTRLLPTLIDKIAWILLKPNEFKQKRNNYQLQGINGDDIYYEYFYIAYQIVLQDKQKQIDQANIGQYRQFAIDYYGLSLINSNYGPYKLLVYWGDRYSSKLFQSLTQYPEQELQASTGPLRYLIKLPAFNEMNIYFRDTREGKRKLLLEGSFIQKIFYPNIQFPFFKKNQQKKFINTTNEPWLSLPKIIWIFWDKGLTHAPLNNQICVQNLRRVGNKSGFVLNQVNLSNVNTYLDEETLKRINQSIKYSSLQTYPQSKSDLYRLALIAKYGGIYMDASYIALQSFDWIVNIGRHPSQYIYNRFGHLPKVFMMWHPQQGSPGEWVINEKYNTKAQWHLAYENNFIAAEKDSELIKEWLDMLLEFYLMPYFQIDKIFHECLIYYHKWSTRNWHYLIPMDTIKCVIGRREAKLLKEGKKEFFSASDYYKIWSMNGYLGQQKLRHNTNYNRPGSFDNSIVYQYSYEYLEGLIGKIKHVVKFYGPHNTEFSQFLGQHKDNDFSRNIHPDSLFMRYMWRKGFSLVWENNQPRLKIQS